MELVDEDNSFDYRIKPQKVYLRRTFNCKIDDIWITIETPVLPSTHFV